MILIPIFTSNSVAIGSDRLDGTIVLTLLSADHRDIDRAVPKKGLGAGVRKMQSQMTIRADLACV